MDKALDFLCASWSIDSYSGDGVLANILLRYAIRRDLPLGLVRQDTSPRYALATSLHVVGRNRCAARICFLTKVACRHT